MPGRPDTSRRTPVVEVCVDSVAGAELAAAAGADRIELCAALETGGLTPSAGLIACCVDLLPTSVLVRPRTGDFAYGAGELRVAVEDVARAAGAGAAAVVVGALTSDAAVDRDALDRLVAAAGGVPVGFSRAFDSTAAPLASFDVLLEAGVARLLTSGAAPVAAEGTDLLAELVRRAGSRVEVIAAGGLTPGTVARVVAATAVPAVHFSATRPGAPVAGTGMPQLPPLRVPDRGLLAELVAAARSG
ncbi:copper homeostasis protein CutC [Nakamurella endophytica]|uniref:PF03932 family protein CutC n=1 Tax=Nakamurella endophytica TaxID=1748367 RepID=A0A917TA00_9ACTN|nr:copper homeostasis protein CutC [Nakamurella endophytica]GGM14935.1 copper homeostasis protein CutC [Nakamurella endophytica]